MRGDQQIPVLGPGERLRLALATAVAVQPVDQPAAVTGPVAGQPGHRDPPGSRRPRTRMTGVIRAAPRSGTAAASSRLAALVFEDDPAAERRRRAFIRGQVSFFHTSTAPSSRSIAPAARRSGRSSRAGAAGTRSPGWCTAPGTRPGQPVSRARASVHRWSSHPGGQRPGLQRSIQRRQLLLIQPALRRLPAGGQPGRARRLPGSAARASARSWPAASHPPAPP